MITLNNKSARREVFDYLISNHEKIKVEVGDCRYNFRCQMNAVHDAICNKEKQVAMTFCLGKGGDMFIHFINLNKGKYKDNTLGVWSVNYDYYLVKIIEESEFFNIDTIFSAYRRYLRSKLNWWTRLTSNETF